VSNFRGFAAALMLRRDDQLEFSKYFFHASRKLLEVLGELVVLFPLLLPLLLVSGNDFVSIIHLPLRALADPQYLLQRPQHFWLHRAGMVVCCLGLSLDILYEQLCGRGRVPEMRPVLTLRSRTRPRPSVGAAQTHDRGILCAQSAYHRGTHSVVALVSEDATEDDSPGSSDRCFVQQCNTNGTSSSRMTLLYLTGSCHSTVLCMQNYC
jgi:hypothetical protein